MAVTLATLSKHGDKWTVIDPRPGHSPESFAGKDVERAIELQNKINAEIVAASEAAAEALRPKPARIEIMSVDGLPVLDIPTVKATDAAFQVTQPTEKNKLKAPKVTTEMDLASITGYVLLRREPTGKIATAYTHKEAADFGRCIPVTVATLATLQDMFAATATATV